MHFCCWSRDLHAFAGTKITINLQLGGRNLFVDLGWTQSTFGWLLTERMENGKKKNGTRRVAETQGA